MLFYDWIHLSINHITWSSSVYINHGNNILEYLCEIFTWAKWNSISFILSSADINILDFRVTENKKIDKDHKYSNIYVIRKAIQYWIYLTVLHRNVIHMLLKIYYLFVTGGSQSVYKFYCVLVVQCFVCNPIRVWIMAIKKRKN